MGWQQRIVAPDLVAFGQNSGRAEATFRRSLKLDVLFAVETDHTTPHHKSHSARGVRQARAAALRGLPQVIGVHIAQAAERHITVAAAEAVGQEMALGLQPHTHSSAARNAQGTGQSAEATYHIRKRSIVQTHLFCDAARLCTPIVEPDLMPHTAQHTAHSARRSPHHINNHAHRTARHSSAPHRPQTQRCTSGS